MNHKNKLKYILKSTLRLLDIFQQFTFVIEQKEQHKDLNIRKTQIDIIDKSNKQKLNIYIYIYMRRNLQIIKNSQTKCVK